MTMKELANLANVSLSTVSKAFCDAKDVSDETKNHIFRIAKQQGCFGKYYKGKYAKKIIAIICPEVVSAYYSAYVECLQDIIEKNNGIVLISVDHFNTHKQEELIEYYAAFLKVDGIIVLGLRQPLKKSFNLPLVAIGNTFDPKIDSVNCDFEPAVFQAVDHLKQLGHKNIAFIGEPLTTLKKSLFQKAMGNIADDADNIIVVNSRFEKAGKDGAKLLLQKETPYTAVICAYDPIAIGAIKQLQESGYQVPRDFSVIGMDNVSWAEYTETSLTSIDTHTEEICHAAWELLHKKQKNIYYKATQKISLTGTLICRESTGPAKKI